MDNFNYQDYIKSGKIYGDKAILIESITEKKQGYDDREDESLGARKGAEKGKKQSMKARRDDSYGKFGKRDAEKKGKNKINKESISETIAEAKAKIDEGSYPFDQCLADNEGKYGKKGAAKVCGAIKAQYGEGIVNEDARTDAEQEGYKDGFEDAKDDIEDALKKMKVSELKDKIKTEIISNLSEAEEVEEALDMTASPETLRKMIFQLLDDGRIQPETADDLLNAISNSPSKNIYEEEEVDVDIDVEDEVEVDAEADDIEIERKGVKAKVEVGLSPEEEIVQDSLKAAMDAAQALGSDKLADQIGNTITFFTRQFVVGDNTD